MDRIRNWIGMVAPRIKYGAGCHFGEIPLKSAHFVSFVQGFWRVVGVKWWRNGRVLGVILVDLAGL